MRVYLALLFLVLGMTSGGFLWGQSPNASISGVVLDPEKKSIADAGILVVNDYTRVQYEAKTNAEGFFVVTGLPPGQYRIQVSKVGFKAIIKPDIVLNVQDALAITFYPSDWSVVGGGDGAECSAGDEYGRRLGQHSC